MNGITDVHCHVCLFEFPHRLEGSSNCCWPAMRHSGDLAELIINAKVFRRLDERSWNLDRRLDDMQREGVERQVLSPMPELLSYWFPTADSIAMCEAVNGAIASMVARRPDSFSGLGMVPMQEPDQAITMIGRLRPEFGLVGVEIGSNINGKYLGHTDFDPIWEAIQSDNLAVFVHALHPLANGGMDCIPLFDQIAGFPADVGLTAASMLMAGIVDRFPKLRVGFSHGGGTLPSMLGRLDMGFRVSPPLREIAQQLPSQAANSLFFDSNIYDPAALNILARHVAPGRIFVGTDYPYASMQTGIAAYLEEASLSPDEWSSLCSGAAKRFLDL